MSGEQIHAMAKVMQESFHQDKTFLDVDTVEYFVKLLRIGFAAHSTPDTVPCDTCGNPVPDRGAAKSWCSDACYGKSGEALVGKLEALKPGNIDHVFTRGFEQCQRKAIAIFRQHYTNSPVCKDSAGQCIQTDHAQREIRVVDEESAGQFLQRVGTNGMAWAEEMHKRFPCVPIDDLYGWCCNMIEAGGDRERNRKPEPVTLAQMCEAYRWNNSTIENGIKAVLDAAGVKYE